MKRSTGENEKTHCNRCEMTKTRSVLCSSRKRFGEMETRELVWIHCISLKGDAGFKVGLSVTHAEIHPETRCPGGQDRWTHTLKQTWQSGPPESGPCPCATGLRRSSPARLNISLQNSVVRGLRDSGPENAVPTTALLLPEAPGARRAQPREPAAFPLAKVKGEARGFCQQL